MAKINRYSYVQSIEQIEGMKNISDKQFREVILAMKDISCGIEPAISDPMVDFIVNSKRGWAEENRTSWEKKCENRAAASRENGKLGGRPKKENQDDTGNPDESNKTPQSQRTSQTSDNEHVFENVFVYEKEHAYEQNKINICADKSVDMCITAPALVAANFQNEKLQNTKIDFSRNLGDWHMMDAELRKIFPRHTLEKPFVDIELLPEKTVYSKDWLNFLLSAYLETTNENNFDIDVFEISEKYGDQKINNIQALFERCISQAKKYATERRGADNKTKEMIRT